MWRLLIILMLVVLRPAHKPKKPTEMNNLKLLVHSIDDSGTFISGCVSLHHVKNGVNFGANSLVLI